MDAKALLARAIAILSGGVNWVKYRNAVDDKGRPVPIMSPRAVKWDIFGALKKAHYESGNESWEEFHIAYNSAKNNIPDDFHNRDIEDWSDYGDFASAISIYSGKGILPKPPKPNPNPSTADEVLGSKSDTAIKFHGDILIKIPKADPKKPKKVLSGANDAALLTTENNLIEVE
jgi:hypothetical protein|nr:MAG TPA: hypothetical protein [Caudoviricetes sp.]